MRRSNNRILVSHAGTVPRPAGLQELFDGGPDKRSAFLQQLPGGVREAVRHQAEAHNIVARDARDYPEFHAREVRPTSPFRPVSQSADHDPGGGRMCRAGTPVLPGANVNPTVVCTAPLEYVGAETTAQDIANFKAALEGLDVEGFLPAIAPGTIEHWLFNEHYASDEDFLFAIADAMHEEYRAITDAGLNLQIDDPDLPDGWQMFPEMSVDEYRKYAQLRVEALNHALRDIPEEQIRLHVCWGSGHGPHQNDIPLEHIVDIILGVKAQVYSVEAANPRHDHEWRVWQQVRLPEGKSLMPGVIGHATDIVEHPRPGPWPKTSLPRTCRRPTATRAGRGLSAELLVADRLVRYAGIVGKENVIAGTDCGVGSRVFNAEIAWGKFAAMVEGARIASRELWGD